MLILPPTSALPDPADAELLAHVCPPEWINPQPAQRYHVVVIGAGAAGLVAAIGARALGARVAIVERHHLGGDCLNSGCIPSKALLHSAQVAAAARRAVEFGVHVGEVTVDFAAVMSRLRRLRQELAVHDSVARLSQLGIDVFLGQATFTGKDTLQVTDARGAKPASSAAAVELKFRRAVIATGGRPALPDIPGLAEGSSLTNETLFALSSLPRRLAIIGGGPQGCELAQAFARFGATVTLIEKASRILPRDDPEAAGIVANALQRDGVTVRTSSQVTFVNRSKPGLPESAQTLFINGPENQHQLKVDALLLATGRVPNVTGLGLDVAGVAFDERAGIKVNDKLLTTNPRILAAGDVASSFKFTHAADALARIAVQNALLPVKARASRLVIPWCTYTDPEVAHVGLTWKQIQDQQPSLETFKLPFSRNDRAILCGTTDGFVTIHVHRGTDRIAAATIAGSHAGELIGELTLLMTARLGLRHLARTVHPYPTLSEAARKTADAWSRTRLTPFVSRILQLWINSRS